jgi:hypothetical protein
MKVEASMRWRALVVCSLVMGACQQGSAPQTAAPGPRTTPDTGIRITTKLSSPTDIWVSWTDPAADKAAGYIVEFASDTAGPYVVLEYALPTTTTHHHPDIQPGSTFVYRVRAFYGPASNPAEVVLPSTLSDAEYAKRMDGDEDFNWGHPETRPEGNATRGRIRDANPTAAAEAGPTGLTSKLMPVTASGFLLTWTDHSSDEQGFFIEQQLEGARDFRVVAVTEKDINKFGYALKPPERKSRFRVRAYYYGKPSNRETLQTPQEKPTEAPGAEGDMTP